MRLSRRIGLLVCVMIGVTAIEPAGAQQPDPDSPRYKGVVGLRGLLESSGDAALAAFINDKIAPSLRKQYDDKQLKQMLAQLRQDLGGAGLQGAMPVGPMSAELQFGGGKSLIFEVERDPPHRYTKIGAIGGKAGHAPQGQESGEKVEMSSLDDLKSHLAAEAAADRFSGVVLVAQDGKPILHVAHGLASRRFNVPNRLDTKFNIGSLNKVFTAIAVYQLIEKGTIHPDDTIGKYLLGFPTGVGDKVTVQHLLGHRAGWGAYWDNEQFNTRWRELRSLDDYIAFIKDIPLDFEPGTKQRYSNIGYEVLGAIIERVTGQSYDDYVREHIFEPAGMTDTKAYARDKPIGNLAVGYVGPDHDQENTFLLSIRGTAAGGGYSTAPDLLKFTNALDDDLLVSAEHSARYRGGGFAGGGPGVSATLELDVGDGYTVIVLANFDPPISERVGREIRAMLTGTSSDGPAYRIGVGLEMAEQGVGVSFLVPDGPAERAGLKPGDIITAINGHRVGTDPVGQFDKVLSKPNAIRLGVNRNGRKIEVVIVPEPAEH